MGLKSKTDIVANDLRVLGAILRGRGELPGRPWMKTTIELSSACNLKCPLCPTGTGKLVRGCKFIAPEVFERIVETVRPITEGFVLSMWGEPALHPQLGELLAKTHPTPTWIATNLNYKESLAREMARWNHLHVIGAVDTLDPVEYAQYRVGGDYDTVLRNLRVLAKGECAVYPQFLVDADYDPEAYAAFARDLGIPPENVIIKIKRKNFTLEETDKPVPGACHAPFFGLFFTCDGHLVPCCNDVHKDLHMGHIDRLDLEAIRSGQRIANIRRALCKDKNTFPSCGRCRGETMRITRLPVYRDYLKGLGSRIFGGKRGPQRMPFREPED